jgi:DNA-directed RNA polymerase specialized sigma24 family protein
MDLRYQTIEELVLRYQEGDEKAGLQLLTEFGYKEDNEPTHFLGKYYNLIVYESMDFTNRDLKRFVSLFSPSLHNALKQWYTYKETRIETMKRIHLLSGRIQSLGKEEILQDLSLILLQQAKLYQQKGTKKNFCGYLYNSFRYALYRHWKYLFRDLHYHSSTTSLSKDPLSVDNYFQEDSYFHENEELGFNWIHGYMTSFPFTELSVYERNLLHLNEVKNLSYEQIGDMIGKHRDTIYLHRKKIKNKLYTLCKQQHLAK